MYVEGKTYGLGLEPLDEDAVEERDDGLDGLESCLGSLTPLSVTFNTLHSSLTHHFVSEGERCR